MNNISEGNAGTESPDLYVSPEKILDALFTLWNTAIEYGYATPDYAKELLNNELTKLPEHVTLLFS